MQKFASVIALATFAGLAQAQFSLGNLAVVRADGGGSALVNTGSTVFIDQFTTSGGFVNSLLLPAATTTQPGFALSGTATSEGQLNLNNDPWNPTLPSNLSLVLGGYALRSSSGSLANSSAATIGRRVAFVATSNSAVTLYTPQNIHSGNNIRSVASTGTNFWSAGGVGGLQYGPDSTTAPTAVLATPANIRVANIYGGQLYVTNNTSLQVVSPALPTAAGAMSTNLFTLNAGNGSAYDFVLFDRDGNGAPDLAYVADDGGASDGIYRYSLGTSGWAFDYVLNVGGVGARSLTGQLVPAAGGGFTGLLYATTAETGATLNRIVALTDTGVGSTVTTLATAPANSAFRGIELIPTPGSAALLGMGLIASARRRRA